MKTLINKSIDFVYFPFTSESDNTSTKKFEDKGEQNISNDTLDDLLKSLGKEILKEKTPSLHELEQTLQEIIKTKQNKDGLDEENDIIYQNDSEVSSDIRCKIESAYCYPSYKERLYKKFRKMVKQQRICDYW